MFYIYNNREKQKTRRTLRNNATDCERILWSRIKNKQCNGYRFLRQYSVGSYILDFYCPKLRLAIELDGGQHSETTSYDQKRTEYLNSKNIEVLRFWNNDITSNLDGVYERLLKHCI